MILIQTHFPSKPDKKEQLFHWKAGFKLDLFKPLGTSLVPDQSAKSERGLIYVYVTCIKAMWHILGWSAAGIWKSCISFAFKHNLVKLFTHYFSFSMLSH